VFLVPHHTNVDSTVPAMLVALAPRAIISNNGPTKGGSPEALALVHTIPKADVWQLHKSLNAGATNSDEVLIANLGGEDSGHWIKVSAFEDGSFTVTNGRTGMTRATPPPSP